MGRFIFFAIVFAMPLTTIIWWIWTHRILANMPHRLWWRLALALFTLLHILAFFWLFLTRSSALEPELPRWLRQTIYVWNLFAIPFVATLGSAVLALGIGYWITRLIKRRSPSASSPTPISIPESSAKDTPRALSRRELLRASVALAPLGIYTGGMVKSSIEQDEFRTRSIDLPFRDLPPSLDGTVIAHVSDTHIGPFTRGDVLKKIVQRTNDLNPDLILVTGDIIDFSLKDLPDAIDVMKSFRAASGVYACEGNHDLFEDRIAFEDGMRSAGVRLLLNELATPIVRGTALGIIGLQWGIPGFGRSHEMPTHFKTIKDLIRPSRFNILLAHHPDAFDQGRDSGIDLTLAGHTHGGQLMLTEGFGPASAMFKYINGEYRHPGLSRQDAACFVTTGVGNWFPLRIGAPAEIAKITLRRA
ncbi:MAG: metallophosphoesterase [Planctomycetes bacterium]|nr:metallophosphoesterase [Planctomycetota bacterium]